MENVFLDRKIQSMFPLGARVVGFVFTILGLIATIGGFVPGLFLLVAGAFVGFAYSGVEIDVDGRSYREYISFLSFKIGSYKHLPEINNIVVFYSRSKVSNNLPMGGAQAVSTEVSCRANLKGKTKNFTLSFSDGNKKKVMDDALLLSSALSVDIVDITEKEKKIIRAAAMLE